MKKKYSMKKNNALPFNEFLKEAEIFYKKAEEYRKVSELEGALINYISASICIKHAIDIGGVPFHKPSMKPIFDTSDPQNSLIYLLNYVSMLQKLLKEKKRKNSCNDQEDDVDCQNVKQILMNGKNCVFFSNIIGNETAIVNIRQGIMYPFEYPRLYPKRARGILFYGPPGTGKTYLVKAMINELQNSLQGVNVLFFAPTGAELKGKYVGETEKKITSYFRCASQKACECTSSNVKTLSVLFIDEIDSIGRSRADDSSGISANATNTLLQMMDGINTIDNVIVIGATNYPWDLDEAILRRFDVKIYVSLPEEKSTIRLLKYYIKTHIDDSLRMNLASLVCKKEKNDDTSVDCMNTQCKPNNSDNFESVYKNYEAIIGINEEELKYLARKKLSPHGGFASFSPDDIKNLIQKVTRKSAQSALKSGQYYKLSSLGGVRNPIITSMTGYLLTLSTMKSLKKIYPDLVFQLKNIRSSTMNHAFVLSESIEAFSNSLGGFTLSDTNYTSQVHQLIESYSNNEFSTNKLYINKTYIESYLLKLTYVQPLLSFLEKLDNNYFDVLIDYKKKQSDDFHFLFVKNQAFVDEKMELKYYNIVFSGMILNVLDKKFDFAFFQDNEYTYSSLQKWTPFISDVYVNFDEKWIQLNTTLLKKNKISIENIDRVLFSEEPVKVQEFTLYNIFSIFTETEISTFKEQLFLEKVLRDLNFGNPEIYNSSEDKASIINLDFRRCFFEESLNKEYSDYSKASSLTKQVQLLEEYHRNGTIPTRKN
jgi:SpoVK/Ycf46/Vps4 family AAA+-type ATPase